MVAGSEKRAFWRFEVYHRRLFGIAAVVRDSWMALSIALLGSSAGRVQQVGHEAAAARRLVERFLYQGRLRGAGYAFLEVAEDNGGGRALYGAAGFGEVGRRRGYFHTPDGRRIDALVLRRELAKGPPVF